MWRPLDPTWIVPQWPAAARVRAVVTTRGGGVSRGPWSNGRGGGGLNLGRHCGDDARDVLANRVRLAAALPAPPRWMRLVHGARAVDAATAGPTEEADAAYACRPGVVCAVTMADCLPVLLADPAGRVVAACHAGWRGLAAGVLQNTVTTLRANVGQPDLKLLAWLGPAIGPDAFEVGDEVRTAMRARLPQADAAFVRRGGRWHGDLFALARQALAAVGVKDIHGGGVCTYSDPERFYSHRRDRVTGRHAALIWLDPAPG